MARHFTVSMAFFFSLALSGPAAEDDFCHHQDPSHIRPSSNLAINPQLLGHRWSHQARCIKLEDGGDFDESLEPTEFCAFTNSTFNGGRGISVITTPETAQEMLKSPAFTEPEWEDDSPQTKLPYYVAELPGRGMGVIANETISSGDLIMSYQPAILIHDAALEFVSREDLAPLLGSAFEQLGPETRASVKALHAQHAEDKEHIVRSIVRTNGFAFQGLGKHTAVFPEVSRFNHDCRPNAMYSFDEQNIFINVQAAQTIQPGEEITISYIDVVQATHVRKERLLKNWGFNCTCSRCMEASTPGGEHSDKQIARINSIIDSCENEWGQDEECSPKVAEQLIELHKQEGLHYRLSWAYAQAFQAYVGVGDMTKAAWYGGMTAKHHT